MQAVAGTWRGIRGPKQARSRRTLDRLLDAAEALLADRTFDELTIADVVKRAGSSVGSFYSRFPDKTALLAAIYDRHQSQIIALLDEEVPTLSAAGLPLDALVRRIVSRLVQFYRLHRGVLRALVLYGYAHPDKRYADDAERSRLAVSRLAVVIASRTGEIRHPDPMQAAKLGVLSVLATLRESILFSNTTASAVALDDGQLVEELSRQFVAYLVCNPAKPLGRGAAEGDRDGGT